MYATIIFITVMAMTSTMVGAVFSRRVFDGRLTHPGLTRWIDIVVIFANENGEYIFELELWEVSRGGEPLTVRGHYTPTNDGDLRIRWDIPEYDEERTEMMMVLRDALQSTGDPAYADDQWDIETFLNSMRYIQTSNQVVVAIIPHVESYIHTNEMTRPEEAAPVLCSAFERHSH